MELLKLIRAFYRLQLTGQNTKLGHGFVWLDGDLTTCFTGCAIYEECYAKMGHLGIDFNRLTNGEGKNIVQGADQALELLHNVPLKSRFRFFVKGDFPNLDGVLISEFVTQAGQILNSRKIVDVIAYTHTLKSEVNFTVAREWLTRSGYVLNFSCDSLDEVKDTLSANCHAVCLLDAKTTKKMQVIDNIKIVTCPATWQQLGLSEKKITCAECMLCAMPRDYVVGFPAHGTKKNQVTTNL